MSISRRRFLHGTASLAAAFGPPLFAQDAGPSILERLTQDAANAPLSMRFQGDTAEECRKWQILFRDKLRSLLGPHEPPRKWKTTVLGATDLKDHRREELLLEAEGHPALPVYLLLPRPRASKKRPGVLALHGHGNYGHHPVAGRDDLPGVANAISSANYDYGRQLAQRGYVVSVPCFTPFGVRLGKREAFGKQDPCADTFLRLLILGKVLMAENLRDSLWALQLLAGHAEVDASRLGCVGLSYGGRMTMLTAALEPRIGVAVISGALNVMQERVSRPYSCGAQIIPGLLQYGDTPEIAGLIAPRPCLWEVGSRDTLMVPKGVDEAMGRTGKVYEALGARKQLQVDRFEGGHVWHGQAAYPLLQRVLAVLLLLGLLLFPVALHAAEPPWYGERGDLRYYLDEKGNRQPIRTASDWQIRLGHIRAGMQQAMGKLPPPTDVPLDVKVNSDTPLRHYTRRHLSFMADKGDRIPAYLLLPHGPDGKPVRQGNLPAVVCLPGSSLPGKDVPAGLTPDLNRAYAHELAQRGYVCLVLDYPLRHTQEYETDPYKIGYDSCTMKGIVNHRRGVDLLLSLPFVDRDGIGVIGHSLGGHNSLFLAVFDPRVKAVVSSCGFNTFAKYYGGKLAGWSSKYYMPRITTVYKADPAKMPFDFTEVLAALAPRPVFINAPLNDSNFEVSGVRDCFGAALPVYRDVFKKAENLVVHYPDAGHDFPVRQRFAAYDFLDRHLRQTVGSVDVKKDLLGHWPLAGDTRDHSGNNLHARGDHVDLRASGADGKPGGAAGLDGVRSFLEIGGKDTLKLGKEDFTLSAWVHSDQIPEWGGDLISQYDPVRRRGFHLSLRSSSGVTFSQPNFRHLQFGIDNDHATEWIDCGRPGQTILAFALAVHEGYLYAGTCEAGKEASGRVHRHAGGQHWLDCGSPDRANAVTALASHGGKLYAGTGKYRLAGSSLPESENPHLGGRIYRHEGGTRWTDCGQLPEAEAVGGLVVFGGQLYASSLYRPAGFFRYEGEKKWLKCEVPNGKRVEALGVFGGHLYATGYDEGHVYRYDGKTWTDLGQLGKNTQTYSLANYQGRLHIGTWPSGRVYRLEGEGKWDDVGRLGEELEVMGMLVHNGRLLAGTLPSAEVHLYEGGANWKKLVQLDLTPGVKYRRAWTMAEHQGQLFCSTLPSGKVFAFEAGKSVSWDHELPPGWRHVSAVKAGGRLTLYVDGQQVARSVPFNQADFDLDSDQPLRIGFGANGHFRGRLRDVRLYRRGLNQAEVRELAGQKNH